MPSASRPPRPAGWSDGTVRRFAARLMHTDQRVAVGEGGGGMVGFGQSTRPAGAPPGPCTDETDTVLIAASSCSTVCGDAGLRCRDSRGRTTGELRQNLAPQGDADDWSWCLPLAAMAGHRLAMATTKDHDRDDKPVPRPAWRRGSSLPSPRVRWWKLPFSADTWRRTFYILLALPVSLVSVPLVLLGGYRAGARLQRGLARRYLLCASTSRLP